MQWLSHISLLDQRLFLSCSSYCERFALHRPARYISRSGDGYLQIVLPLCIAASLPSSEAQAFVWLVIAAYTVERSLYATLKKTLKRKRPPQALPSFQAAIVASDEFSFPSGHTCAAFLLWVLCTAAIPALGIPLLIWAIAVGISRVVLGVHFPADIIAGAGLGYGIGQLFLALT